MARTNSAATPAFRVSIRARSVTFIRSILQIGLNRPFPDNGEQGEREPAPQDNIRGRNYFH